jgi:hypothetical protein
MQKMTKWLTLNLLVSLVSSPLLSEEQKSLEHSPYLNNKWIAGDQWFKQIEANYKHHHYDNFLNGFNEWYQQGLLKGELNPLIDGEKELIKQYNTLEGKKLFERLESSGKKYDEQLAVLKKERDNALQQVVNHYPSASISERIRARLNTPELTKEQLSHFEALEEWLSPFPLHAPTPLLEQIKSIAFEFKVKEILLKALYAEGDDFTGVPGVDKLGKKLLEEYRLVLVLEKLNRMLSLANKTDEKDIRDTLLIVLAALPTLSIEIYNGQSIEESTEIPVSEAEKKTAEILNTFNTKKQKLLDLMLNPKDRLK